MCRRARLDRSAAEVASDLAAVATAPHAVDGHGGAADGCGGADRGSTDDSSAHAAGGTQRHVSLRYGRSYAIEASVHLPEGGAEGVLLAFADFIGGGFALWVDDAGRLTIRTSSSVSTPIARPRPIRSRPVT
jgi:hypothetical protein